MQWLVVESTSGLDRACVLLPLFQPELLCQKGIPVACRHDIIYLFCTIRPPFLHYLFFLESVCIRVGEKEQNVSVAQSRRALGLSENNRLIEKGEEEEEEAEAGAFPALFLQVERFLLTAGFK